MKKVTRNCPRCQRDTPCSVGIHTRSARAFPFFFKRPTQAVVCDVCKNTLDWVDPLNPKPYTLIFDDGRIRRIAVYDLEALRMTHNTVIIIEGHPKINEEIFEA